MSLIISNSGAFEDPDFAAEMTNRQFNALRIQLDKDNILSDLCNLRAGKYLQKSDNYERKEVAKWLANGWNTEHLLKESKKLLSREHLAFALHWAFPQAYYSSYALILAYFKTVGHSARKHTPVIRKYGKIASLNKYPKAMSFLANGRGNDIKYQNISKTTDSHAFNFNPDDKLSVENMICKFLSGTRKMDLEQRRVGMASTFKTKKDMNKLRLTKGDWKKISDSLGYTSLISLLYRKRIKSNYRGIDSFLSNRINAEQVFDDLSHILSCLNIAHETFIHKAVGKREYKELIEASTISHEFVKERANLIRDNLV